MTPTHYIARHLPVVAGLLLLALWLPLPLYLVSLALFGLPHVIWEAAFIRSRYAARWPLRWWLLLWTVLLAHAGMRLGLWWGGVAAQTAQILDLLALLLLALVVALAPRGAGWPVRIAALGGAFALFWLLQRGHLVGALFLLAMAHNFTPLAMAWDLAREHAPARPLAWLVGGMFVLPLLVLASGWSGAALPSAATHMPLLDGQAPTEWDEAYRPALLSAMVLAQCLHYYCVIHLLPQAQAQRTARRLLPSVWRYAALALAASMALYFAGDYGAARKLYGAAAGLHAWLEWPVLLMAFLALRGGTSTVQDGGQMRYDASQQQSPPCPSKLPTNP